MENRICSEFPSIATARACVTQKEYGMAADIYSEVLETAAEKYDQRSETMCMIYLEYSHALISLFFSNNYDKLRKLSLKEKITFQDNDDDLETAWSLLEICRITFEEQKNTAMLVRTHFLLGEVLLNNDKMEEALAEYEKAEQNSETAFRKALCYEFLGDYRRSIQTLEEIKTDNEEMKREIELEITLLENKKIEEVAHEEKKEPDSSEVINISMNIRKKES